MEETILDLTLVIQAIINKPDNNTNCLFEKLGLSQHLRTHLKNYGITTEVMKCLTLDDLNDIFPNAQEYGDKIIFRSKLLKWRASMGIPISDSRATTMSNLSSVHDWIVQSSSNTTSDTLSSNSFSYITENNFVNQLIKTTVKGKTIEDGYKSRGLLNETEQNNLVHLIVEYLISTKKLVGHQELEECVQQIKVLFPNENIETYYFTSSINNGQHKRKLYGGKLYNRYVNSTVKRKKSENNLCDFNSSVSDNSSDQSMQEIREIELLTEEKFEELKLWLKSNCGPWDEVCDNWGKTACYRVNQYRTAECTISDILDMWPLYNDSFGYQLIELDFNFIHPGKTDSLIENFDLVSDNFIKYFEQNVKDKANLNLLLKLKQENIVKNSRDCIIALVLHAVIPPNKILKTKKPTVSDSQNDFVIHAINLIDINRQIEKRRNEYYDKGIKFQPIIIVVGPNIMNLTDFYVYSDGMKYKLLSFQKCLDIIVKLMLVFNFKHSTISKNVWIFLQQFFYDIPSNDCNFQVATLIKDLKAIR